MRRPLRARGLANVGRGTRCGRGIRAIGTDLSIIRTVIAALLLGVALPAAALAQTGEFIGSMRQQQEEVRPRGIEHELSLEQSRVNARSASELQRRQTRRDVEVTEQRLRTFK